MDKTVRYLGTKKVEKLYDIRNISLTGEIDVGDKKVGIYRVNPANIIACDNESKFKIYQAYLTCIRGLPDTIQIVISKERTDMKHQIEYYKNKMLEIESINLKLALKRYIEYLEELTATNKLYKTTHYLVIEDISRADFQDILDIFENLKEFGVTVKKVSSKEEVLQILKEITTMEKKL